MKCKNPNSLKCHISRQEMRQTGHNEQEECPICHWKFPEVVEEKQKWAKSYEFTKHSWVRK